MSRRDAPTSPSNDKDQSSTIPQEFNQPIRNNTEALYLIESTLSQPPNSEAARASVLSKLAEYDLDSVREAISYARQKVFVDEENTTDPVEGDDSDFPKEYQIEILRKRRRTLKAQRENLIFDKYLACIKNKIQELQGRKKEIEKRAITARKNFETPDYDKRKLKKHELNVAGTVTTRVKAYWKDSMSMELKKELLRIRIEDLILHLDKNIKSSNLVETVMDTVEYVKVAKKWKFSMCCCCGLRFFDAKLNVEHIKRAHLGSLSKKLLSITQEVFDLDHNAIEFGERRPAKKITEEDMSRRVFEFLDYLNNLYGIQSVSNDEAVGEPCVANYEKIVFNEDFSCVVFDKRMLRGELVVPNDGAAVTSSFVEEIKLNDEEIVSKDAIVDWLLKDGTNVGEQLKQWANFREISKSQAMKFFKIYRAEFHLIQSICKKKFECLRDIMLWQNLESICVKEDKRREEFAGDKPLSYMSLLLKRQREIKSTNGYNFESDMIFDILGEEQVEDNEIRFVIMNQINKMAEKLYKFDAIVRTATIAMQQTGKKIESVTAYDYRSYMVPLLKSFMRARLEDLAYNDAEEKSKAATEALLSELDLSDKKGPDKGGGRARQRQGKSKDKKKKKDHRKAKEQKAIGCGKEQQENVVQIFFTGAQGRDDPPNPEIVGPVPIVELEQEGWKLTLEQEREQRMLEEHLQYQRQIENGAKQKHLAELNKAGSSAGNMEKMCLRRINFDDFNWKYFYQAQGVKSDEK
ncbi:uncharacterized protein LOC126725239 [Quercus robur]|uniref:uncharacterized protein LOC126725239 n=1 Tax=Quercus robur TaxID=38942 RepID=UPI002163030F|nr:uncharacterized protein LOC126725239 [Quercus robur]XP_050285765.1 uncharacterized protein LOC126725239 [Quercus robur]